MLCLSFISDVHKSNVRGSAWVPWFHGPSRSYRSMLGTWGRGSRSPAVALIILPVMAAMLAAQPLASTDMDDIQQAAMKAAVARVAPSVVQIETSGGSDVIGSGGIGQQIRKGTGPTTGLIVSPDGYI